MHLVSWNWFWYVLMGFFMGGGAVFLWHVLTVNAIRLAWYEWGLIVLSFVTFLFLGQTFIASFAEGEPRAAWMTVVFMGIPIVLMVVIAVRSAQRRLVQA